MKLHSLLVATIATLTATLPCASAQSNLPFIGELRVFANSQFCPRNWAETNGQLLPINSNSALFSLFGTTYGGDGRTTFGLPDLRAHTPIGAGTGPGLTPVRLGQASLHETTTLTADNIPHSHGLGGTPATADSHDGEGEYFAALSISAYAPSAGKGDFYENAVSKTGQTSPAEFYQQQPTITMRWCVALQGIFPSRS